jgi:cysteinyl-tRNA synthetase
VASIRIHDQLRRSLGDFNPVHPGKVGMYVCGLTVQGLPHIGHLRAVVVGDVMRRYLAHRGFDVTLVHNFTDVEDKIIERGVQEGVDFRVVAERNIAAYQEASKRLGALVPTVEPRVTDHMPEILDMIRELVDKGHAYESKGDVYFSVESFPRYGQLSGRRVEELRAGSRIEIGEEKRAPEDFALWKAAKPGEPSWPSPWSPGRPGWHIECSAMAIRYLGPVLDLHGGGMDLVFPHHENEIAQSEAVTGKPFANHWVQHGLVNLSGEKMSKSTGHFFLASDVFKEVDPAVVRYYLMTTHYRSPIEFSRERLSEAESALKKLRNFLADAAFARAEGARLPASHGGHPAAERAIAAAEGTFQAGMDEDFNTARALAGLFELVREIGRLRSEDGEGGPAFQVSMARAGDTLVRLASVLGVNLGNGRGVEEESAGPAERLREERERARMSKDWARADAIRVELQALGWAVEDHPGGSRLKRL